MQSPLTKSTVLLSHPSVGAPQLAFIVTRPRVAVTTQPSVGLQLPLAHTIGVPDTHTPLTHESFAVQAFESEQLPVLWLKLQAPVLGSQVSVVHTLLSSQTLGVFTHAPVARLQLSVVQALPSSQDFGVKVQLPVEGLQASIVQRLLSSQVLAVPVQIPFWQESAEVQRFPSSQAVPDGALVCTQPAAGLQLSVVQALLSLQVNVPVPG